VTSLLGGLLGFAIGLWLANTIVGALTWSNTSNTKVQFLHGLIVVVMPFLGMMLGARPR
jgi:membrane protein YqaA with SNARE-associated domain